MRKIPNDLVDVIVTSPPYFNARDYSTWDNLDDYLSDMRDIFTEAYRVLNNHKALIVNVGDIVGQTGKAKWATRKIPLGAYFIIMLEEIGFEFIDDYIWNKGEPQSKRHLGNPPYPHYQYPVNSYEHILVFRKHRLDKTKIPCPVCNEMLISSNSQSKIGVQSWECKNPDCSHKSASGRGKRFSTRSVMMEEYKKEENVIDDDLIKKWRKDIVLINPVVKINSKGINTVGHSAPYPIDIPEMAIKFFSGKNELVLDMFIGSGTTAIASMDSGRNFIGFELDKDYFNLANERIGNHKRREQYEKI